MRFVLGALAAIAVATAAAAAQSPAERHTFAVGSYASLSVVALHGDFDGGIELTVDSWDKPQIEVTRTLHNLPPEDVATVYRPNGTALEISTTFHGKIARSGGFLGMFSSVDAGQYGVRYQVRLPAQMRVAFDIVNGNVAIDDVTGTIDGSANNGDINVAGSGAQLHLSTNNGSIEAGIASIASAPAIHLSTNNGAITMRVPRSFNTKVHASVNNGSVVNPFASASGPGSASLTTNNGAIAVETTGN